MYIVQFVHYGPIKLQSFQYVKKIRQSTVERCICGNIIRISWKFEANPWSLGLRNLLFSLGTFQPCWAWWNTIVVVIFQFMSSEYYLFSECKAGLYIKSANLARNSSEQQHMSIINVYTLQHFIPNYWV